MNGLTNEELIFLDNLIYLNFEKIVKSYEDENTLTVGKLINKILLNIDECAEDNPACMTKEQWTDLLTSFANNEKYQDFLNDYVVAGKQYESHKADEGGHRACCFVKRDNNENIEDVVVIFRGTSTNETEWSDNVLNANRVWSYPMDESVMYINNLPEEYGNNITVSGHSKVGNRSQYVTILTDRMGLLELLHIMCYRNIIPSV